MEAALEAERMSVRPSPSRAWVEGYLARMEGLKGRPRAGVAGRVHASEARSRLQQVLSRCAGVFRTERGLLEGLAEIFDLREEGIIADGRGLAYAVETAWMLDVAEMIVRAALLRDESRGPHLLFASDGDMAPLPRNDAKWRRYIVIRKGRGGAMALEPREPVAERGVF